MKIRIKGPSVRLRLSRTEVNKLVNEGVVEDHTPFGNETFSYALQKVNSGEGLTADFKEGKMTMYVPQQLVNGWEVNDLVSIDANMPIDGNGQSLYLLLEKDFQCIDNTTEDESDNYINPNKTC